MKKNIKKILSYYFEYHRKSILLITILGMVFSLVLILYDTPKEPIIYGILLCLTIGIILCTIDFAAFYRYHNTLINLKELICTDISTIPDPQNIIEREYTNLLKILAQNKSEYISIQDSKTSDMIDYYTLWVHQIKTPISAMKLIIQTNNDNDKTSMKKIETELFKIEQYVDMVLAYQRLKSVSTDYIINKYDLEKIINQALRKYAILFIYSQIKLIFEPIDYQVLTDKKWLLFVIEQVLSNALKYTQNGTISIYMDGCSLIIEDTGIGIAQEDLPRIFDKGFTGFNGHQSKKSTGLGLYLCKSITKNLSHSINITSDIGKGTRVSLNLDYINLKVE